MCNESALIILKEFSLMETRLQLCSRREGGIEGCNGRAAALVDVNRAGQGRAGQGRGETALLSTVVRQ